MTAPKTVRPATATAAALLAATLVAPPAAAAWWLPGSDPVPPRPIVEVQSSADVAAQSMRIDRLEDQMRQLNGRIDELTWLMRQVQEELKRSREDTEYRLQDLEGGAPREKRSDAAPAADREPATLSTGPADAPADLAGGFSMDASGGDPGFGEPPRSLGTVPADPGAAGPLDLSAIARGDETWGSGDASMPSGLPGDPLLPSQLPAGTASVGTPLPPADVPVDSAALPPPPEQQLASLSVDDDPRRIYDEAYAHVVAGDYEAAEAGFRRFLELDGSSDLAGDASFWLGESLYARDRYRDAADAFLTTYRDHPRSRKAPDSLLKLGLSLEGLGETDAACATYRELEKKFPDASGALLDKVGQQKSAAGC